MKRCKMTDLGFFSDLLLKRVIPTYSRCCLFLLMSLLLLRVNRLTLRRPLILASALRTSHTVITFVSHGG